MRRALVTLAGTVGMAGAFACPAGAAVQVSQSGWQWGNPTPQGNTIRAIDTLSGRAYAVGDAGTALRTDDGGSTWRGLNTGTALDLDRLQVVTPDVLVVTGGDGCVVRRSDDGGTTFHRLYVPTEIDCPNPVAATYFVTPQVGYLLLRDGSVLRTADGGQTFSKQTAVPGTKASTGGGQAVPADIVFTSADRGLAFVTGSGGGQSLLYVTTDQGVSWKPVDLPQGLVRRVTLLDAQNAYAVGPETLLRTTDGGATWTRRPAGTGRDVTSIRCADPQTCMLTLTAGDRLLRTTDAGATASEVTPATQAIDAAAFVSPARVVAAGAGGTTVISDDGGLNYVPVGGDIGGSYSALRAGASPTSALALGTGGQIARTSDGGSSWKVVSVPTSANVADASFSTDTVGYALDDRGGLFKTVNAGQSWQTLDPGTTTAPLSVAAIADTVLLAGPRGINRQVGGGRFDPVASKAVARARLNRLETGSGVVAAFGAQALARSTNRGATWTKVPLPNPSRKKHNPLRVRDAEFLDARHAVLLDGTGRLWSTANTGRTWSEIAATGTQNALSLSFASPALGFLAVSGFPADASSAFVLRTDDGGRTWAPQRLSVGSVGAKGVLATSTRQGFALSTVSRGPAATQRQLFGTATGGSAGQPSRMSLTTKARKLTRKALRRANGRITVAGTLAGAQGGEQVVVSRRAAKGGIWTRQVVTVGANGGSFTATFHISASSYFVAQWAGDSGRASVGTRVLGVSVTK